MIIQHVVPLDDLRPHLMETDLSLKSEGGECSIGCACDCGTRVEIKDGGGIIIIHGSFDGREWVERALEMFGRSVAEDHPAWGIFNEEK